MRVAATPATDVYVAAFLARRDRQLRQGCRAVDAPGLHGLLCSDEHPGTRVLVCDDRAYGVIEAMLPDVRAGTITVLAAAGRCAGLIAGHPLWTSTTATAMLCRDLRDLPVVRLPGGLAIRSVRRVFGDAPDGVALDDAVKAAMRADPHITGEPDVFAEYLRSLPAAIHLFAAVDEGGAVRATAGWATFDSYANVIFVNTDPLWRGRGIGQAMTATALQAARESGARQACLDASESGRRIYTRLGFERVAEVTRFHRSRAQASRRG